ncbi:hypothetical protein NC981_25055 [Leptolyngbya sp. DQ-M1]
MKAFKPELLRLLREQLEPRALPLSAEQLVASEKAAVVLAVGTSEKELQAYMRGLFNESGVLRNLYAIWARQKALQGSQEFLKIFTAATSLGGGLRCKNFYWCIYR